MQIGLKQVVLLPQPLGHQGNQPVPPGPASSFPLRLYRNKQPFLSPSAQLVLGDHCPSVERAFLLIPAPGGSGRVVKAISCQLACDICKNLLCLQTRSPILKLVFEIPSVGFPPPLHRQGLYPCFKGRSREGRRGEEGERGKERRGMKRRGEGRRNGKFCVDLAHMRASRSLL